MNSPFMSMKPERIFTVELTCGAGVDIVDAINQAKVIAKTVGLIVSFKFNGVVMRVNTESVVEKCHDYYRKSLEGSGDHL